MAKDKEPALSPAAPEPMPATGCVVCGSYVGTLVAVTENARSHEACAAQRPDVIAKVKARA